MRVIIAFLFASLTLPTSMAEDWNLSLRYQQETKIDSGRFHTLSWDAKWNPKETAIIVCDVWDYHHCFNAVRRLEEFLPRLNEVVSAARQQGSTIIHAPSDCMPAYEGHPARLRAMNAAAASFTPQDCSSWCSVIPQEEKGVYPIDQSDGGEDDDPEEHAKWAAELKSLGRNPNLPWKRQADAITIDDQSDFITDKGDEVWNVLQSRELSNVILVGVHTNMCVLGRPFGLRQMARNGKNVVLMRDMTDTMYNPKRWPFVSHFTGTDLIVSHVEKYVCPTITSDQIIGGETFRFKKDQRPHLVILIAENEYDTDVWLPNFASQHLGRDFRVTTVFGSERERNQVPGIEAIKDADALLISVRRRVLPDADLKLVRDFVAAGKPIIGIRTSSHAFSLRNDKPPKGFADWPELDAQVFGGNYHGHHANKLKSTVTLASIDHAINAGIESVFPQGGSLYKTSPLATGATILATAEIEGQSPEPVAWTFKRADGGRSFYTSLGHVGDFQNESFTKLLYQGICWATDTPPTKPYSTEHWSPLRLPHGKQGDFDSRGQDVWYRAAFRFPSTAISANTKLTLKIPGEPERQVWVNGEVAAVAEGVYQIPASAIQADDANLIVIRLNADDRVMFDGVPTLQLRSKTSEQEFSLAGTWQRRTGDDDSLANIPLPPKFGASAEIVFDLQEPRWSPRVLTVGGQFTPGIEGPACDSAGNIYAVNFQRQGTIGKVDPFGSGEVFLELPEGSVGNGIRFDRDGHFYVADYTKHNIWKVNVKTRKLTKLAHHPDMNQPNDLAIAPDGTLYASDPNWKAGTGQIWRIDPDGKTKLLAKDMGTTNGIEVSPDGKTLYVNESKQRNIWAFQINDQKLIENKRLVKRFEDHGFDGMRCDVDGNLYVTRYGAGMVVKMTPQGEILKTIPVLGAKPSNLCFGGPDGCTVYVTEVEGQRLVSFRVDRPGRAFGN